MSAHSLAGKPAPKSILTDVPALVTAYFVRRPSAQEAGQEVSFGTSGHRGCSLESSFNEDHILAITQAVCEYRSTRGSCGPLFLGKDTHALSEPAQATALEVLAAHGVEVVLQADNGYTPTPVISHAILQHNRGRAERLADGIVITPSHNPPDNGGFKYNPPHGGPADSSETAAIQKRANEILASGMGGVRRMPWSQALGADDTHHHDFVTPYVTDLGDVVDMDAIASGGLRLGVDPMGGAGVGYWEPIAERYGIDLTVVNPEVDPTFRFMRVDHDGKIRMDCSSPHAMSGLIELRSEYDLAFGNDPDTDRHGIVTRDGLMNPNHYLAAAISYLFAERSEWPASAAVGKTLVSSAMIDRVARDLGRPLYEVPVGFKWFVSGLVSGDLGFGGEESAGASFLRKNGTVWSTDKDGIILDLLAAEMTVKRGRSPSVIYAELEERFGRPVYQRIDAPATPAQKERLRALSPDDVAATTLAGETITAKLTAAPGNGAEIGGLKVTTENGWFAARPSGTENVYKIYAESFLGADHLARIQEEAKALVGEVLG